MKLDIILIFCLMLANHPYTLWVLLSVVYIVLAVMGCGTVANTTEDR